MRKISISSCYMDGAKTKMYSVSIKSELYQYQMAFQETEYYKEKAKHRYKIEAKNSELKNVNGYNRAIAYGITNIQMQGTIAIFTVNLKRILKLIKNTEINVEYVIYKYFLPNEPA